MLEVNTDRVTLTLAYPCQEPMVYFPVVTVSGAYPATAYPMVGSVDLAAFPEWTGCGFTRDPSGSGRAPVVVEGGRMNPYAKLGF